MIATCNAKTDVYIYPTDTRQVDTVEAIDDNGEAVTLEGVVQYMDYLSIRVIGSDYSYTLVFTDPGFNELADMLCEIFGHKHDSPPIASWKVITL